MNLRVADVSGHQNITNYDLFRSAFDAFYIKVTEGDYYVNPLWQQQNRGLGGKLRAAYHFMGNRSNIAGQVSEFISESNKAQWEWGPVLDAEFTAGDPTSVDIRNWIAEWRKQSGKYLIYVYIGRGTWLSTAPANEWADAGTRIIGARYYANDFNNAFKNFGLSHPNLDAVQYWDKGTAPGLNGIVDLNNFTRITTEQPQQLVSNDTGDDDMSYLIHCDAGKNLDVYLPLAGCRGWAIGIGNGKSVNVHRFDYVKATPDREGGDFAAGGFDSGDAGKGTGGKDWIWSSDRPGPVWFTDKGVMHLSLRYTSADDFTLYAIK